MEEKNIREENWNFKFYRQESPADWTELVRRPSGVRARPTLVLSRCTTTVRCPSAPEMAPGGRNHPHPLRDATCLITTMALLCGVIPSKVKSFLNIFSCLTLLIRENLLVYKSVYFTTKKSCKQMHQQNFFQILHNENLKWI